MYPIWGKAIMSSDHLLSCTDNVLRQQDGFEGHLTYMLLQGTRYTEGASYNVFNVARQHSEVYLCGNLIGTDGMP